MKRRSFMGLGALGIGTTFAATSSPYLSFIPRPSAEKWAVLFCTWCGTARDAAMWISEGMGGIAAVFDVRQKPDLKPYDHLVLGTAIRGGRGSQLFDEFVAANLPRIKGKVRGLFAVCGNLENPVGPEQKKNFIDNYLSPLCQAGPVPARVFNGRITRILMDKADYEMVESLYKSLNRPPLKDYDHLRRADCLALGHEILSSTRKG